MLKKLCKNQKGFTLIELLIVIAIIGILLAVIVPNVSKFTSSGEKAAGQSEQQTIQTAIYAAMAEVGQASLSAQVTVDSGNGTIDTDVDLEEYLQSGIAGIKGEWIVDTTGRVVSGEYGDWVYSTPDGIPTWEKA